MNIYLHKNDVLKILADHFGFTLTTLNQSGKRPEALLMDHTINWEGNPVSESKV